VSESFVRVLERSAYLGVRDERSRELLVRAGVDPGRLEVAPDSVLTLPRIWPSERLTPVGAQVLREAGIRAEDEPLVFQVAPWLVGDRAEVVALLQRSAELGRRVVGLAMGSYSGEHELIADLVRDVKGAVMLPVLDVERTAAVIAASSGVVTSSFHAGITAGVYGRTVAFLPGAERKALGLMAALDAEPSTYIARSWADGLLLEGQAFDASAVVRAADSAARAVDAAVDRVLA
jgi:polysaccharide pyruvyl transferase WcaK-like protein